MPNPDPTNNVLASLTQPSAQPPSIFDMLRTSTVRIEAEIPGAISTGTGFFWPLFTLNGKDAPAIVTNKHVIAGATAGTLRFKLSSPSNQSPSGQSFAVRLQTFEQLWIPHPDPQVDLAAMLLLPIANYVHRKTGQAVFTTLIDPSICPTTQHIDDMCGAERVVTLGYPNAIWDEVNNEPVMRSGILASNFKLDWRGLPEFLIDAAIFPGASGSPVFIADTGAVLTRRGTQLGASRILFLGVVNRIYTMQGNGQIVAQASSPSGVVRTTLPLNLGICIKSAKLKEFSAVMQRRFESGDSELVAGISRMSAALPP